MVSGLIGTTLGMLGGYFGGWVDRVVMFVVSCRLAIPLILVALTVVAMVGSSLTVVMMTLGLLLWERFAVVSRSATMQVAKLEFVVRRLVRRLLALVDHPARESCRISCTT